MSQGRRGPLPGHFNGSPAIMPSFWVSEEIDHFLTKEDNLVYYKASFQKVPRLKEVGWAASSKFYIVWFSEAYAAILEESITCVFPQPQRASPAARRFGKGQRPGAREVGFLSQALSQLQRGGGGERGEQQEPSSCLSHIIFSSVRLLCD